MHSQGVFNGTLLCADCDKDPELKKRLGCGVPPVPARPWFPGRRSREEWTPEKSYEAAKKFKVPWSIQRATTQYKYANLGWVNDALGKPWPWCPRWFECMVPPDYHNFTARVFQGVRATHNNMFEFWVGDSQPTPELLERIMDAKDNIRFIQHKQDSPKDK